MILKKKKFNSSCIDNKLFDRDLLCVWSAIIDACIIRVSIRKRLSNYIKFQNVDENILTEKHKAVDNWFFVRYRSIYNHWMKNANAYGTKKKYMDDLINFFLSLGRELEVVLLQVIRRNEMPKTNYGRR